MIPKTIHYCWFGGKPLPQSARRCIASWRKYLPDYEVKEWNESNFDVNMIPYTAEAYAQKKYAFVSDFARLWLLHEHGGIYFDTDVELIRPLNDILARGAFMGIEAKNNPRQERFFVNPGLGCACGAGNPIWGRILAEYKGFPHFDLANQGTICTISTMVLEREGIRLQGEVAHSEHISLYPPDFFCPQAMYGAPVNLTANTRSIHHFDCTWLPLSKRIRLHLRNMLPTAVQQALRKLIYRSTSPVS